MKVATKPRQRRRRALVAAVLVVALWLSLTAKLFVWPADRAVQGARADAILVMNGPGPRSAVAHRLAREHAAPVILWSVASVRWDCPGGRLFGVKVVCFRPDPFDTRGEARFAAARAHANKWKSLIVVSSVPQATRALLRVKRCFSGAVEIVAARPTLGTWAYDVLYEWGALAKALVWQRSC